MVCFSSVRPVVVNRVAPSVVGPHPKTMATPIVLGHPCNIVVIACATAEVDRIVRDFRQLSPFAADLQVTRQCSHPSIPAASVFVVLSRVNPSRSVTPRAFASAMEQHASSPAILGIWWWSRATFADAAQQFRDWWDTNPLQDDEGNNEDDEDDDDENGHVTSPVTSSPPTFGTSAHELRHWPPATPALSDRQHGEDHV